MSVTLLMQNTGQPNRSALHATAAASISWGGGAGPGSKRARGRGNTACSSSAWEGRGSLPPALPQLLHAPAAAHTHAKLRAAGSGFA